jgi:putative tributyrin esterase
MRDVSFRSVALGRDMAYRVILPAKLEAGRKLPVVYLLHGNGGGYREWSNGSEVAGYAAKGLILVMPEGGSSYFLNAVERPQDRYEDYLVHDLVADVEGRFPARMDRIGRAIVGVSMGGFAAIKLGLSHPEMFVFTGALSPPIDAPERRFTWRRAGQWLGFRSIFGPWGSKERDARDPFVLLQTADPAAVPYVYLTAGENEPLLEPIQRFAARLSSRGIAHEFHTKRGGHDWTEWDAQIPACFDSLISRLSAAVNP